MAKKKAKKKAPAKKKKAVAKKKKPQAKAKKKTKAKAKPKAKAKKAKAKPAALSVRQIGPFRTAAVVRDNPPIDFAAAWHELFPLKAERQLEGDTLAAFRLGSGGIHWYAAAVQVSDDDAIDEPLTEVVVPRGRYVVHTYVGGYEGLGAAWPELIRRVQAAGHDIDSDRVCVEIYTDDGSKAADKKPRTDLCVPV